MLCRCSGQFDDAEERLIGLGLPYSIKRMAVTVHPLGLCFDASFTPLIHLVRAGSLFVVKDVVKDANYLNVARLNRVNIPVIAIFIAITKLFMYFSVAFYFYH